MSESPYFSIILPTYNRASFLARSINSVLIQAEPDFELIIVDDGSTDNTRDVVQAYSDPRIHYYYKENQERNFARNYGIEKSRGRYICFLDSDDYYLENHLSVAKKTINESKATFLHLGYKVVQAATDDVVRVCDSLPVNIEPLLIYENVLSANSIVVERTLINTVLFIKSSNYLVGEDHLLWLQLHARVRLQIVNVVTTVITEHATRSLTTIDPDKYEAGLQDFSTHILADDLFFTYYKNLAKEFIAGRYRFGALLFAIRGNRVKAIKMLFMSASFSKKILLRREFYAVIKNLV